MRVTCYSACIELLGAIMCGQPVRAVTRMGRLFKSLKPKRQLTPKKKRVISPEERERRRVWQLDYASKKEVKDRVARRYHTDSGFCMMKRLRSRLTMAMKRAGTSKSQTIFDLVGCNVDTLKAHLSSQFKPGMNWENRSQWHIDHRIPCAKFDLTKPDQQRKCFHFSNLQPLWKADNLKKSDKLELTGAN